MADDEGTIYHLLLDKAEANFIHKLRDLDPDGEDPSSERIQKLTDAGTVQLKVSVGDRDLDGTYPVSATALVFGCAEVGLKIQEKLLSQEWIDGAECRSDHHSDAVGMQYHTDEDPSQLVNGKIANETISWDKIRSEVVPSYVQNVTFTIAKSDLMDDRQKELEEQFPGVTIKEASSSQSLSGPNRSAKRQAAPDYTLEKPNGVKTAVFELDKYATTRDEALEANIRKQFPWATIDPAINTPTTPRALRQMAPVVGDVENQLQDFTTFMTDYPPDGMFDVNVRHNQIWSTLPLPTKLNLAHARAIQIGRYSETRVPATRCGNCKRNNYACKIYRHDFIEKVVSTNHLSLGEGCQHCRLLGLKCDLPPYRARSSSSPVGNDMENAGPPRAGRAYSVDLSSEATMTLRASRQLSVAKNFTWKNEMIDLALELGLTLTRPDILWSIYTAWRDRGSIRNYHASSMNLQYYYINLVNLHIMARSIGNPELEFATLLQFQITNFEQEDNLPDINKAVIKAFEHLPVQADLCRWIAIVFSYVWNTVEDGDYEDFLKKNIGVNKAALCKFLYAVAYVRDPHTEGGNLAVLQEWCTVHDHIANSAEDKYCMNAERACKNKLKATESSPNKADNGQNRLNKRSFEGPSGPRRPKKFKHNDGHQYDSRPTSRSSAAKERNAERDGHDSTDDAYFTGEGFVDDMSSRPQSLRSAGSDKQQANIPAGWSAGANDPPHRKPGRPRKKTLVDEDDDNTAQPLTKSRMRSGMASMLSSEHLDSLPFNSDFDLNKAMDEQGTESTRAGTAERLPERSIAHSEEPTPERRSARAKALPQGFFRQHLPRSQFGNTMWGVFRDD